MSADTQKITVKKRKISGFATDVYIAAIPTNVEILPLASEERNRELEQVSNVRLKAEKYCAWRLLEYAFERSFGKNAGELKFEKTQCGKWICDGYEFSISHCYGAVAVAVSNKPVGVDIECTRKILRVSIANRILSDNEKLLFDNLEPELKDSFLLRKWTQKESLFKRLGEYSFSPSSFDTTSLPTYFEKIRLRGIEYYLSVASDAENTTNVFISQIF